MSLYVYGLDYEETKTGYASPQSAKEDLPAASFGGRRPAPDPVLAGVAGILPADQEAGYLASGRRRSGLVPETGAGLPDQDQPGAAEADAGREKEIAGMR